MAPSINLCRRGASAKNTLRPYLWHLNLMLDGMCSYLSFKLKQRSGSWKLWHTNKKTQVTLKKSFAILLWGKCTDFLPGPRAGIKEKSVCQLFTGTEFSFYGIMSIWDQQKFKPMIQTVNNCRSQGATADDCLPPLMATNHTQRMSRWIFGFKDTQEKPSHRFWFKGFFSERTTTVQLNTL